MTSATREFNVPLRREPPAPIARTPSPPEFQRAVTTNVRRHVSQSVARVATLLVLDIASVVLVGDALVQLRDEGWYPAFLAPVFGSVFTSGYLRRRHFDLALIIGLIATGTYGSGDRRRSPPAIVLAIAFATALQLWGSLWTEPTGLALARYAGTVVIFSIVLVAARVGVDSVIQRLYSHRAARRRRVILVGDAETCEAMQCRSALSPATGVEVVGVVAVDASRARGLGAVDPIDEIEYQIHRRSADTVVICGHPGRSTIQRVVKGAMASECQVDSWDPAFDVIGVQPQLAWRNGQPILEWRAPTLRWWQMVLKRALDVLGAACGLALLSPALALIALVVRLDSPGPAVFGQLRLGRFGRPFRCYKFRSMHADAEQRLRLDAALYDEYVRNDFKLPPERDARVTRIGRFLRRTSLDELPQLWNVLRGDMSLVGPRPIVPDELRHYSSEGPLLFLSLRPGLTGAWQVNGRSSVAYPARTQVEMEYVQRWSLIADVLLLLRTVPAVFAQRGAH